VRTGYTAVVVPATLAEVSPLLAEGRPGSHVLELTRNVIALETAEGQHDSEAYYSLATKAAEKFGSAVLVACLLSYPYQSAHVFRRGKPPQLFVLPSTGPSDAESQHFGGLEPSWVALPLVEGLDLAGLNGGELAAQLCKRLGKHEHAT
jgi:hypothetical protein